MKKLSLYLLQLTKHPETRGKIFSDRDTSAAKLKTQEDCLGITCFYANVKGRSVSPSILINNIIYTFIERLH